MERASSDEEDDHETLVPKSPHRRSTFEIADPSNQTDRSSPWFSKTQVIVVISIPIVLILLYFSLSNGVASTATNSLTNRMRESELRSLQLLRSQQLALLRLFNQTHAHVSSPDSLRSSLLDQIKLNQQIQKTLLSAHRTDNFTKLPHEDNVGTNSCPRLDWPKGMKKIEWKPKKDRFLFAICISGQMSNHLICLEKHMFFAALLGRTLVLPSHKLDYKYDEVLDFGHINSCFSTKVVVSFDEFFKLKKSNLRIDRFMCYMASPPCFLDKEHIKRIKDLGIFIGKIEAAWPEDAKLEKQKKRVIGDIVPKFDSEDEVIAIGDMFYADVEEDWLMQPGGPIAHKCKTLIQPSRLIILTAQRFVQTFLGRNFVALHFRRHGFLKFCNVKEESCFFPIPQAADCILRVVERIDAPVIYLSTDAAESETDLLQSLLVPNGDKTVPLVKRPSHTSVEKWDALLYRNKLGGNNQVEAMLDKTICAMSSVFIGASGSTFTEDIIRLRRGWGYVSQCDEYLCRGEQPNFIADNE